MSVFDTQPIAGSPATEPAHSPASVVIAPSRGWGLQRLRELWEYRELLYFLVWRDVKVRYKQTALGAIWAIAQPLLAVAVFTVFFGILAKIPSDGLPYVLFGLAGLLPWQFFSTALSQSANSLVNSANLVRKVYFPRLTVPIASTLAALVDFGITFVVMLAMMAYFQVVPTLTILLLPLFLLLALMTVMGMGLWLSAINVQYRDVRHIVPFMIQFWMYATPVVYPSSLVNEPWRTLYGLNPMVGVVEGFRWALLGTNPPGAMIAVSASISVILFVTGLFYFQRVERKFADVI